MKAIALLSGGLDSTLAARFVHEQGIALELLHFKIPFCSRGSGADTPSKHIPGIAVGIREIDIGADFLDIVKEPTHGYGSLLNPCIDCKILMLRTAKAIMEDLGVSFIVTGEVLGQRPMSQHKKALKAIEEESGLPGLILRPLSARLLPETIPEKQGWVHRDALLDFQGRGRRPQIALAERLGIMQYAQPAGGCLLTDPQFSLRLKDLIDHEGLSLRNVELLKVGRHFRLGPAAKLVVGRNEKENNTLLGLAEPGDYLFLPPDDMAGPTCLARGVLDEAAIRTCCRVASRYCDLNDCIEASMQYTKLPGSEARVLTVAPAGPDELAGLKI